MDAQKIQKQAADSIFRWARANSERECLQTKEKKCGNFFSMFSRKKKEKHNVVNIPIYEDFS